MSKHETHNKSVTYQAMMSYPVDGTNVIDFDNGVATDEQFVNIWCDTCDEDISYEYRVEDYNIRQTTD